MKSSQAALEGALADLCLGAQLDFNDSQAIQRWATRHGVASEDIDWLTSASGKNLAVYRRLVRGTLREALSLAIPRTMARLGELFECYFDRFLAERAPRTHYLRDVTSEFITFCRPLWQSDPRVEDYLIDLARHEALEIELAAQPVGPAAVVQPELDLERPIAVDQTARVMRYDYAVHRLSEEESDRSLPVRRQTYLLVYRDADHDVRYLELTALAGLIFEALVTERVPLKTAILGACDALRVPLDESVVSSVANVLSDLAKRGVLRGSS